MDGTVLLLLRPWNDNVLVDTCRGRISQYERVKKKPRLEYQMYIYSSQNFSRTDAGGNGHTFMLYYPYAAHKLRIKNLPSEKGSMSRTFRSLSELSKRSLSFDGLVSTYYVWDRSFYLLNLSLCYWCYIPAWYFRVSVCCVQTKTTLVAVFNGFLDQKRRNMLTESFCVPLTWHSWYIKRWWEPSVMTYHDWPWTYKRPIKAGLGRCMNTPPPRRLGRFVWCEARHIAWSRCRRKRKLLRESVPQKDAIDVCTNLIRGTDLELWRSGGTEATLNL